jgi:hypothetical protein
MDKKEVCRAWRSLFLTETGDYKPEADIVMRDLEKVTGWMTDLMPTGPDGHVDPLRLAGLHEKRRLYAFVKKRLFEPLRQQQKEDMNG